MNQTDRNSTEPSAGSSERNERFLNRLSEGAVRAVVWAIVGAFFALLFKAFYVLAGYWQLSAPQLIVSGTMATVIAALIYGSMRLAVLIAAFASVFSVAFLITQGDNFEPAAFLGYCLLLGLVVGALYGWLATSSRIGYADAKILAGLSAGLASSSLYWLLMPFLGVENPAWAIAVLCPIAGLLYVTLVPAIVRRVPNLLPAFGDGAVIGSGISLFVGLFIWIMAGAVDSTIIASMGGVIEQILADLPLAMCGGVLGGFLAGFLSGVSGKGPPDMNDL